MHVFRLRPREGTFSRQAAWLIYLMKTNCLLETSLFGTSLETLLTTQESEYVKQKLRIMHDLKRFESNTNLSYLRFQRISKILNRQNV